MLKLFDGLDGEWTDESVDLQRWSRPALVDRHLIQQILNDFDVVGLIANNRSPCLDRPDRVLDVQVQRPGLTFLAGSIDQIATVHVSPQIWTRQHD